MPEQTQRTYYSRTAALQFPSGKPKRVIEDGESKLIHPKLIQFSPIGSEHWGIVTTTDPEMIAALEERLKTVGDIMTPEQYNVESVPAERRISALADQNNRLIEDNNRLMAQLQEAGALNRQRPKP